MNLYWLKCDCVRSREQSSNYVFVFFFKNEIQNFSHIYALNFMGYSFAMLDFFFVYSTILCAECFPSTFFLVFSFFLLSNLKAKNCISRNITNQTNNTKQKRFRQQILFSSYF